MHEGEIVLVALLGEFADLREIQRRRVGKIDHHLVVAVLEHVEEHRAAPALGGVAFGGRAVFERVALVALPVAPAEAAALIDRMQRVDDDQPAREFQPFGAAALAEAAEQFVFGQAGQPLAGQPVHQRKARGQLHAPLWRAFVTSERPRAGVAQPGSRPQQVEYAADAVDALVAAGCKCNR